MRRRSARAAQLYTSRVLFELRRHPLAVLPEPEIRAVVRFTHSDGPPTYFESRSIGSSEGGRWPRSMGRKRAGRAYSCALSVTS
jgi:hypothetical protein